jgi:glycosyltransferase involved in cell wall biosynthesis
VNDITHESSAPRPTARRPAVVSAIIPCLDEEAAIAQVVTSVFAQDVSEVVVVDGGSRDRTADQATAGGARVIVEPRRGYGRAIKLLSPRCAQGRANP